MKKIFFACLVVSAVCASLPSCRMSDAEINAKLGLDNPGEPANISVEQLVKHMDAATDPQGRFKNATSYILRQLIVDEIPPAENDNPFGKRKKAAVDQYESEIIFRKPDFERQTSFRNGEPFNILLFKEGRAWNIDPKTNRSKEITGHQLRLFHIFNSFSHPSSNLSDVFANIDISTVYLNHVRHYRIVCRTDDDEIAPYVIYVDAKKFYTTKMETILYTDYGQEFLYSATPKELNWIDGVLIPTYTITKIGDKTEVIRLKEFDVDVTFSESDFKLPEKFSILRKKSE